MVLALMAVGSPPYCHQKGDITNGRKAVVLEATSVLDGCLVEPAFLAYVVQYGGRPRKLRNSKQRHQRD